MLHLLAVGLATMLFALSVAGVILGGIKSGSAMSRYSSGIRQVSTQEGFQDADLDRIQHDQRTAPLEAAQGLAEAAISAQTLGRVVGVGSAHQNQNPSG